MSKHEYFVCRNCTKTTCVFCDGGLALCTVCRGAEGSIPTDCPGRKMTDDEEEAVYAEKLDYRSDEGWVSQPSKFWQKVRCEEV